MIFFYFNDCLPKNASNHRLICCLQNTLKEYNEVKKTYPEVVDGIITEKELFNNILNQEGYTLGQCIYDLDSGSRRFAFSIFNKYPIAKNFEIYDEDGMLSEDYLLTIDTDSFSAINLAIVSQNDSILFTLPVHDELKNNQLTIKGRSSSIAIDNLFGETDNTNFIKSKIEADKLSKLDNFEKLLAIIGNNTYSDRFKRGFEHLTKPIQDSIICQFKKAKNRNGVTNLYSDEELIKDVTPNKEADIKVFELRIFTPVAYRVYFYEATDKVYLAIVEKKPPKKVQVSHIISSRDIIKELIIKEVKN